MRFFFDYTNKDRSLRDYLGEEFRGSEEALEFAETTAQVLKNNLTRDWIDWSVEVSDAAGRKYFSFPVEPGRPVAANAAVASVRSTAHRSLLIVEDEPIHSALIGRIADKAGFTTTVAHSYDEACKMLGTEAFDSVTLDLGLGEHVGVDLLRFLATIGCSAHIIVVSHADKDVCDAVMELGKALGLNVCGAVTKPIDLAVLHQMFRRISAPPADSAGGKHAAC